MKARIQVYKNTHYSKKGYPVIVEVHHGTKRKRIKSGFHTTLEQWHELKNEPLPIHPEYYELIFWVHEARHKIAALRDCQTIEEFSHRFEQNEKRQSFPFFHDYFFSQIKHKRTDSTQRLYTTVLREWREFAPRPFQVNELTYLKLYEFKHHMLKKGFKENTVHNYLRHTRAIMYEAGRMFDFNAQKLFQGLFKDVTVQKQRNTKKYISMADFNKINAYQSGTSKHVYWAARLFSLSVYLGGVDLIDLYNATEQQFREGFFSFHRHKLVSKGYLVRVPVLNEARAIIEEFKGTKQLLYFKEEYPYYLTFRTKILHAYTTLQKQLEIEVLPYGSNLGSKVARHSFANFALKAKVPFEIRRALMGHERSDIGAVYEDMYDDDVLRENIEKIFTLL